MDKIQIQEKLREIGIDSENCYPKTFFSKDNKSLVGLFEREMKEDFYFFSVNNKKIYKLSKTDIKKYATDNFMGQTKRLVPVEDCEVVWEDKPHVEMEDRAYNTMTLREYACIQLGVPQSGNAWLDNIIKTANSR